MPDDIAKLLGEGINPLDADEVWGESLDDRAERESLAEHNIALGGRKTKMTPELTAVMCKLLKRGCSLKLAAGMCGVHISTVHRWLQKGERQTAGKFREFRDRLELARRSGQYRLLSIATTGAALDPKLALDMLARQNPDDYGVTKRVEQKQTIDVTGKVIHEHEHHVAFARTLLEDPDANRLAHELLARYERRRAVLEPGGARVLPERRALASGATPSTPKQ